MAADEDRTTVELSDGGGDTPKKGGMGKIIMFAGIGVVCIALGVAGALFLMKPSADGGGSENAEPHATESEKKDGQSKASGHGSSKKSKQSKKDGHGGEALVYAINDIVVNPAGTGGSRFLSVSFGFELGDGLLASSMEQREPLVRDALITILSSKSVAQLTDVREREIMRLQVKRRVAKLLATDQLMGVYFTDFVLQ